MSDAMNSSLDDAAKAKAAGANTLHHAEKSLAEAAQAAKAGLTDAARRAQDLVQSGVETVKTRTHDYRENAGRYAEDAKHYAEDAQRYVVERVKEKPLTATLAGVGVGLLLGLLLANRSSSR
jgi:ElaB/YqjD/DUF883 family membrane-anchored ribosome-binding protein